MDAAFVWNLQWLFGSVFIAKYELKIFRKKTESVNNIRSIEFASPFNEFMRNTRPITWEAINAVNFCNLRRQTHTWILNRY